MESARSIIPKLRWLIGTNQSLLATLLKRRFSTHDPSTRRHLEQTLDKVVRRCGAFQTVTAIPPLLQMCHALDDTHFRCSNDFEALLVFIEECFSRFMSLPYSTFDEAAALNPKQSRRTSLSRIVFTLVHQFKYKNIASTECSEPFTEWLCHLLFRMIVIGENEDSIFHLIGRLHADGNSVHQEISCLRSLILQWTPSLIVNNIERTQFFPGDR